MKSFLIITSLTFCSAILPPNNNVSLGEAPFFAYFTDGSYFCGATLIQKDIIISAGHCVHRMEYGKFKIGLTLRPGWDTPTQKEVQTRYIKKSRIHPSYSVDINGIQALHDIGLILLNEPVIITEFVRPIDIGTLDPLSPGMIYGLGSIDATEPDNPKQLRSREMHVTDDITCTLNLRETKYKVTKECQNFCSGAGCCWGDSGGPFVQNDKLVGVISWAADDVLGCETDTNMFVRVTDYYEWIHESIEDMRSEQDEKI